MGVKDYFIWYQKKIGKHDKQKWEATIEQKILYGLTHIQMKNAKLNNDFIDLDLIRGSPLSKIKPKQGLLTITKLATLRCIFLPFYSQWWKQQTSFLILILIFCLYIMQLVNITVYFINYNNVDAENNICMELIVPFLMLWVWSLFHSQIAATNPSDNGKKTQLPKSRTFRRKLSLDQKTQTDNSSNESTSGHLHGKLNNPHKINFKLNDDISLVRNGYQLKDIMSERNHPKFQNNNNNDNSCSINDNNNLGERKKLKNKIEDDRFDRFNGNCSQISQDDNIKNIITSSSYQEKCNDWVNTVPVSKDINYKNKSNCESRNNTDLESDAEETYKNKKKSAKRCKYRIPTINIVPIIDSTNDTDDEYDNYNYEKTDQIGTISSTTNEWMNVTTNSEDCSYSTDLDETDQCECDLNQSTMYSQPTLKVSCIIWKRNEIKKAELSMWDISSAIIGKVESTPHSMDYFFVGIFISTTLALMPALFRFCNFTWDSNNLSETQYTTFELIYSIINKLPITLALLIEASFGTILWERTIIVTACLQRWILASLFFFLLSVAENTFKQRFLYAKLFTHLTSFRRAQQSELPHFRLNKVRNIKTWLSVRSYLKQRAPQRSVDVIVSMAFIITLLLLSFLCVEILKETGALNSQYHVEALIWCLGLGILLLRFMTLGNKINKKYKNLSVLITEQINLHLQIEQKPHKKDELTLANNVLKLAIDLIKELQSPFKISGLSANSILYNITKLILLSALSGVLSELLGFKLKLHKIKIK